MKIVNIILSLLVVNTLFAQNNKVFRDHLGIQGEVEHNGEWEDTILPQKGDFLLKWRDFNVVEDTLTTFKAKGKLKNHTPINKWVWEEAGWNYFIEPGETIEPEFKSKGKHAYWEGTFDDGLPNGKWNYYYGDPIINKKRAKSALTINVEFKDGKFFNSFNIKDNRNEENPVEIIGFCDENGVAEGIWTYEFNENGNKIKETRIYNRGILLKIITQKGDVNDTVNLDLAQQKIKVANGSNDRIIIGEKDFGTDGALAKSQELFNHLIQDYFLCGWKVEAFPYNVTRSAPVFKRFAYPLSNSEKSLRDSINDQINELEKVIQSYLGMGNVFINRNRSKELDLAVSVLEATQQRINILNEIIKYSKKPDFIYLDRRNGALNHFLDSTNNLSEVRGEVYPEAKFQLNKVNLDKYLFNFFQILVGVTKEMENDIKPHLTQIEESFLALSREGELKELENEMSKELMKLDTLYKDRKGIGNHVHQYWIKTYLQKSLKNYANTDDYKKAKSKGENLLNKTDSLIKWVDEWSKIDSMSYTLKESYTNFAYNPYTGDHDIELPLKKKFINNVLEYLIPWLKEELIRAEEWGTFVSKFKEIKQLNTYLIEFSVLNERSDRRVERRLRRETKPEKMARILKNHMENR
ncbi:MAG: hypothetical protein WED10_12805 [Brumimicrobium sp.]